MRKTPRALGRLEFGRGHHAKTHLLQDEADLRVVASDMKHVLGAYLSHHLTGQEPKRVEIPSGFRSPKKIQFKGPVGTDKLFAMVGEEGVREGKNPQRIEVSRGPEATTVRVGPIIDDKIDPLFTFTGNGEVEEIASWLGEIGKREGVLPGRNASQLQFDYVLGQ